jgi:succinoglycan biosynthesis protein ExoA
LGIRLHDVCAAAAGIAAIAMQTGWSFGFFAGLKAEFSENGCKIMPRNDRISR